MPAITTMNTGSPFVVICRKKWKNAEEVEDYTHDAKQHCTDQVLHHSGAPAEKRRATQNECNHVEFEAIASIGITGSKTRPSREHFIMESAGVTRGDPLHCNVAVAASEFVHKEIKKRDRNV